MSSIIKRDIVIVGALCIGLMLIGSFWDYSISGAIYDQENAFGIVLAAFGELPFALSFVFSGFLMIFGRNRTKKGRKIVQVVFGGLFVALGVVFGTILPSGYLPFAQSVSIIIGFATMTLLTILIFFFVKKCEKTNMTKVALTILFVALSEVILINVLKGFWGRPRMRFLAETPDVTFQPWWIVGTQIKDVFVSLGVSAEEFRSFPSGHVGNAACLIMLSLLPYLKPGMKQKQELLFFIGILWALLVAFSRIILGAHFLTDTAVALIVTSLIFIAISSSLRLHRPGIQTIH